jgi:hypothetical protein
MIHPQELRHTFCVLAYYYLFYKANKKRLRPGNLWIRQSP